MTSTCAIVLWLACLGDASAPAPPRRAADDHARLAAWCRARGHEEAMRAQAQKALALDPNHAEARSILGFVRVADGWQRVHVTQEWLEALQLQVNADLRQLASAEAAERDRARDSLLQTARIEGIAGLADHVERIHRQAARVFTAHPRSTIEVQATRSTRVRTRTVGSSLSAGTPVRFQLPELRTVTVGTTVGS